MSMSREWSVSPEQRLQNWYSLAHYIGYHRKLLHLTIDQAAAFSGLTVSEWCALEDGWVPEDDGPVMHSVAETLQVSYLTLHFAAAVARFNQMGSV